MTEAAKWIVFLFVYVCGVLASCNICFLRGLKTESSAVKCLNDGRLLRNLPFFPMSCVRCPNQLFDDIQNMLQMCADMLHGIVVDV